VNNEKYKGFCVGDENDPSTDLALYFVERKCLGYEIQHEEYPLFEWYEDPLLVSRNHSKRRFPMCLSSLTDNTNEGTGFLQMVERVNEVLLLSDEIQETRTTVWKRLM